MRTPEDQEARDIRDFTPSATLLSSPLPEIVPFINRTTGLTTWQPYPVAVVQRRWLSEKEDTADLEELAAEYRPKKQISFQLPATHPSLFTSALRNDLEKPSSPLNATPSQKIPAGSKNLISFKLPLKAKATVKPSLSFGAAAATADANKASRTADRVPIKKSKKHKVDGLEDGGSVNKVKKPTPNQRYQAMTIQYLSCPDKLAILEEHLKSLPVDTTDLCGTH
jgi:hypothetical protein